MPRPWKIEDERTPFIPMGLDRAALIGRKMAPQSSIHRSHVTLHITII
jgi:hypothetical protein